MGMLSQSDIEAMGFRYVGKNVFISQKASFYNCKNIVIGDNSRIDDFCILSAGVGGIEIGHHVHVAAYTSLIGAGKITLQDFSNLSSRVSVYSSNDDYSGQYMTNPTIPEKYTNVRHADVLISKHVIVGSGSVILPGVILSRGAAIGAMSLVNGHCKEFGVYAGTPAKYLKARSRNVLEIELIFMKENQAG